MAELDAPPDGFNADAPPDGFVGKTDSTKSGMQLLSDAVGHSVSDLLSKPISAFRQYMTTPTGMAKALPVAGSIAGTVLGPGGMTAGAMLGQTGKDLALTALGDPEAPQTTKDALMNLAKTGVVSGATEGVGQAVGAVAGGAESVIGKGISWVKDLMAKPQQFEDALASAKDAIGTTDALSTSGGIVKQGLNTEMTNMKTLKNALYEAVPDVNIPVKNLNSTADTILLEQGKLPKNLQTPSVVSVADAAANELENPSFQALNTIRSKLGDMVANGEGTEKMYAARMLSAMTQDINSFAETGNPLNQMVGQQFHDTFTKATAYNKAVAELTQSPLVKKLQNSAMEDLPSLIFKKGNVDDVLTARAALGDDGFQAAKQAFGNDLLTSGNMTKTLMKYEPDFLASIFNPGELSTINGVAKLQQAAQMSGKLVDTAKKAGLAATGLGVNGVLDVWLYNKLFGPR